MTSVKQNILSREERFYFLAFVLSLLLHLLLLLFFMKDLFLIDLSLDEKELPEEVTVLFPENRPTLVVENVNENDEVPDRSDLLSDRNSRAKNEELLNDRGELPASEGNVDIPNLTQPSLARSVETRPLPKTIDEDALTGERGDIDESVPSPDREKSEPQPSVEELLSTNNILDQTNLSVGDEGTMTLSTYAWDWAPYINAMKRKLYTVWYTPIAYHRYGLIHGYTVIEFTLSKDGRLLDLEVLEHNGHESLESSSVNAIRAVFPFKSLPDKFPDKTLTITARMGYPDWRARRE